MHYPQGCYHTLPSLTSSCIVAPGLVRPGAMMLAPLSTNLIAPVSARSLGIMSGYCRWGGGVGKGGGGGMGEAPLGTSLTAPVSARSLGIVSGHHCKWEEWCRAGAGYQQLPCSRA